jgi:RNA polymerase sigma-54 factor
VPEVESVLRILQSFDPPGIAARDLRECLILQIRVLASDSAAAANAERIVMDFWEDFSRMKLKAIAAAMNVSVHVVREACEFIRDGLNPRPASGYSASFSKLAPRHEVSVGPDVVVRRSGDSLVAEVVDCHGNHLSVDQTYDQIHSSIKQGDHRLSDEDCKHIREHVERVKAILDAIVMRKKTLARVAAFLVDYQKEFVLNGPSHLKPLRQKDVAKELGVHESTICRAVASKFCRLPSGEVISFDVFFDSALPIRTLIGQLIARSTEPLSDGEITKGLAEQGITIARRTVAKYREQLKVLPYQMRGGFEF